VARQTRLAAYAPLSRFTYIRHNFWALGCSTVLHCDGPNLVVTIRGCEPGMTSTAWFDPLRLSRYYGRYKFLFLDRSWVPIFIMPRRVATPYCGSICFGFGHPKWQHMILPARVSSPKSSRSSRANLFGYIAIAYPTVKRLVCMVGRTICLPSAYLFPMRHADPVCLSLSPHDQDF
jgi:hypothetical protein